MPTITVIIPTYNRQEPLLRALQSVLAQTYTNFECIIVDDGSTDATAEVLLPLLADARVSYLPLSTNHGVSYARNRGIEKACGEWIAFLDSDDTWHPTKLAEQMQWLTLNPTYKIVQTNEIWMRHNIRVNAPKSFKKYGGHIFERCLNQTMITASSVLIHTEILSSVGLFDETLPACEDYDLWLRIAVCYPIGLVENALITRYGGAEDQLSTSIPLLDQYRVQALANLIDTHPLTPDQKSATCATLCRKSSSLYTGAHKRRLTQEAQKYRAILDQWSCSYE